MATLVGEDMASDCARFSDLFKCAIPLAASLLPLAVANGPRVASLPPAGVCLDHYFFAKGFRRGSVYIYARPVLCCTLVHI